VGGFAVTEGDSGSNVDVDPVEAVFFGVTLFLAGIHLYMGLFAPEVAESRSTQFIVIGAAFLVGFLIRFTPIWQPVLYLLGVGFAVFLAVIWVLSDVVYPTIGLATGLAATVFVVLALYLFVREMSPTPA
jgi:hypothetical protein